MHVTFDIDPRSYMPVGALCAAILWGSAATAASNVLECVAENAPEAAEFNQVFDIDPDTGVVSRRATRYFGTYNARASVSATTISWVDPAGPVTMHLDRSTLQLFVGPARNAWRCKVVPKTGI